MRRYAAFDAVAVGEGEITLVELLEAWGSGRPVGSVAGIAWRDPNGDIRRTAPRPRVDDLDSLAPPAWDLVPGFPHRFSPPPLRVRKSPAATLVTSRGCPFECSFCDRSIFGRKVRFHSVEGLVELVGELWGRGVREILFEDDTFTANGERVRSFCEQIAARFPGLSWSCLARASTVNPAMLRDLKRAGCWQISYGIESGDPTVLQRMLKNTDLDEMRRAVEMTRAAGIHSKGFFILGYPGDTRASIERTIEFALSLPLDDVSASMFTPFPGSPIYSEVGEWGAFEENWDRMSLLNPVFVPTGLCRRDIEEAHARLVRQFYARPRIVWNYARRALSNPRALPAYARGLASFARSAAFAGRA